MDMIEPEQQVETIRLQMQEVASFLTNKMNASQAVQLMEREDISNHISILCDNLAKFRALLVEIGFDAAGSRSSMKKNAQNFMKEHSARMRQIQEQIAEEKKIRIRDKLQLIPFQEPEEYMHEYCRLHPHQEEEEEETELTRFVEQQIAMEERLYATYRNSSSRNGSSSWTFKAETTLSPMYYTYCTPDDLDHASGASLQIFSVKIAGIKGDLKWPLYVYGVVAARDRIDFNSNILFHRTICVIKLYVTLATPRWRSPLLGRSMLQVICSFEA